MLDESKHSGRRRAVRRGLAAWLFLSLIGAGIVMVPDDGARVVTLSEGHGPSVWDLVGVALLMVGWVMLLFPLVGARKDVPAAPMFVFLVVAGLALVAWSVTQDAGSWWVLGACVAAGSQLAAAGIVAFCRR